MFLKFDFAPKFENLYFGGRISLVLSSDFCFRIDLLLQTRKVAFVVEVKRQREIGEEVEEEVVRKVARLPIPRDRSVRTALVYKGRLAPVVRGNAWFDAIVPFAKLLGRDDP